MKRMTRMKRIFALAGMLTMFIVQIVGSIAPVASTINQEGNGTITYTLAYQRTSRQFAGTTTINLFNNDYNVDPAPGTSLDDTINTDLYRVTATHVQTPIYTETAENFTTIRVLDDSLVNDTSHVNQTEDFIIPEDENAVWKLVGNMETRPSQLNATSVEMELGTTSDPLSRLNVRDSIPVTFTAERGGEYRTEKFPMLLDTGGVNYTTNGEMSIINSVYQNENTLRTSDSDGTGLDYTLGGSDPEEEEDYYSMFFGAGLTTTATRIQLRRYSYLYSNNFVVTATIWFKVYVMDWGMSEITGDEEYDLVYEWERSRNTYHNAGNYYTNSLYLDLEPEHFGQFGSNYLVYLRIDAGMDWDGIALTGQRVLDWTTVLTMQQQDLCVDGVLELDDIGVDGIHSPAGIKLRELTNMNGAYYHYAGNEWVLLQSVTGDSAWHDHDLADVTLDDDDPKIRFLFYKESLPITFWIDYCNVSAFVVPVTVAINITHDGGGLGNQVEELDMSLTLAEYDDAFNFTVEYTLSSDDFALWDHENPCYVADQLLNITFTSMYYLPRVWIKWSILYSLNSYETPSVLNVTCNSAELSDTSISAGFTEFADWQSVVDFDSNEECYARVTIDADLSLERTLTFVSRTLFRDQWDLEGITNATITRVEIEGVFDIAQIYIGGTAYGDEAVFNTNYALQRGSRLYLSIVLHENIYKPVKFLGSLINTAGTMSVDIFTTFNQHYIASQTGNYGLEYTMPERFTANQTQIALGDDAVSQTYWNENLADNAWNDSVVTTNDDSAVTVAGGNATLHALNYTYPLDLDLTDFANGNLTRNGTSDSVYSITNANHTYNTLDGLALEYDESRAITDMTQYAGTATWTQDTTFEAHATAQQFDQASGFTIIYADGAATSGWFEFWFYFTPIQGTSDTSEISIVAGSSPTGLWSIQMKSDGSVDYYSVEGAFDSGTWNTARLAFDCTSNTADLYINDALILEDEPPALGDPTAVTLYGFMISTYDTGYYAVLDGMGTSWDAGYDQGDNLEFTIEGTPDPAFYEPADGRIWAWELNYDEYGVPQSYYVHNPVLEGKKRVITRNPASPENFNSRYMFPVAKTGLSASNFYYIEFYLRCHIDYESTWEDWQWQVGNGATMGSVFWIEAGTGGVHNRDMKFTNAEFPVDTWTHVKLKITSTHVTAWFDGVSKGTVSLLATLTTQSYLQIWNYNVDADEFQIQGLSITGINDYRVDDLTTRYRHALNVTGNDFEDGLSNYAQITTAGSGDIHLESTTVHDGLKGVHYILPNMSQPNDAILDYTLPSTTWNVFSFWIRFPTDDEDMQFAVDIDNGAGNTFGEVLFYDRSFTYRSVYYQSGSGQVLWLGSSTNAWDYNTWYEVTFVLDWRTREYTLVFNGNSTTEDFCGGGDCDVASRARLFRGYPDPGSTTGIQAFLDDFEIEFTNINYTFSAPDVSKLAITLDIDQAIPVQGVWFYMNSTKVEYWTASATVTYTVYCREITLSFGTLMNLVDVQITANYTSVQAIARVDTTLVASDLDYVQALQLNFTAGQNGGGFWSFVSGSVSLEYAIVANGTFNHNITAALIAAGKTINDLDLDEMVVSFYVDLNDTKLIVDNLLLFDESQAFYVNGTKIMYDPGDGCAYFTSDSEWTHVHYAISRLSDDSYSITTDVNATWEIDVNGWTAIDTLTCEPGATLNEVTTQWFLIKHTYNGGTAVFINGLNPAYTNTASFSAYAEHEIVISDGNDIDITLEALGLIEVDEAVLFQTTPSVSITSTSVEYVTSLQAAATYPYHSVTFDSDLDITTVGIIYGSTALNVTREGMSNTFYWTSSASIDDLFSATLVIDPGFDLDVLQTFNNGTNCTLDVSISSCVQVENVSVFADLNSLEIYMQHWNVSGWNINITQAENRIINFTLPIVNETNHMVLSGWTDVPVASIDRYAVEGFQFIDVDEEALYYGYLDFDVYSRAFRLNMTQLGRDYVLDGVHYDGAVLDIDSAGLFTCSGWGTGISSAYVRFTAAPIARVTQIRVGNIIRVEVDADLPLEMANYVLNVEGETKRVTFQSSNYTWMNFNDTAFLIQGLTVNVGINVFYVEIKVIDPLENLIYVLPVVVILIIIVVIYLARKNKWTKQSVTEAVKDAFTLKKKKKRNPTMKPTKPTEDDTTQKIVFDSARVEITAKKEASK